MTSHSRGKTRPKGEGSQGHGEADGGQSPRSGCPGGAHSSTQTEDSSQVVGSAIEQAGAQGLSPRHTDSEARGEAGWEGGMQSGSSAVPRPPPSRCSRRLWGPPAPSCCPRTVPAFRPLTSDDRQPLSLQLPARHLGLDVPPSWPSSETFLLGHHTSPAAQARKRGHPDPSPPRHPPPRALRLM